MEEAELLGPVSHTPKHSHIQLYIMGWRYRCVARHLDHLVVVASAGSTSSFAFTRARLPSSAHPAQTRGWLCDVFIIQCCSGTPCKLLRSHRMTKQTADGFLLKRSQKICCNTHVSNSIYPLMPLSLSPPSCLTMLPWPLKTRTQLSDTWKLKLWKQNWNEQLT